MSAITKTIHAMSYDKAVQAAEIAKENGATPAMLSEYETAIASHKGRNAMARPSKADRKKALLDDLLAGKMTREEHDKAVEAIDRTAGEMTVEVRDGKLCIEIEMQEPAASASGKTLVVASSRGNAVTTATVDGKPIIIGLNAYIKP